MDGNNPYTEVAGNLANICSHNASKRCCESCSCSTRSVSCCTCDSNAVESPPPLPAPLATKPLESIKRSLESSCRNDGLLSFLSRFTRFYTNDR